MILTIIVSLLTIALGILFCFYGYRYMRKLLMGFGFLIGFIVAYLILSATLSVFAAIVISILIGAATGVLLYYLYVAGIFFLGASFGGIAVTMICSIFSWEPPTALYAILIIVCAIVVGVLAVIHRRTLIILSTAFTGGIFTAQSCCFLFFGNPSEVAVADLSGAMNAFYAEYSFWITIAGAALAIAGLIIQFLLTAPKEDIGRKKKKS